MTFPKTVGQIPYNFPTKPNAQWEGEKSRVNGALYYFGHGLSYTTFALSNARLADETIRRDGSTAVSVDVTNTGTRAGTEVVQLYIRDCVSSVTRPLKELKGFAKVALEAGETKTITLPIACDSLAFFDLNMEYVVEPGDFTIMVGTSSRDCDLQSLTLRVER